MKDTMLFDEVLDAAERLTADDQETLLDILGQRLRERRKEQLLQDVREAQKEFEAGGCNPATPDEIMNEILS